MSNIDKASFFDIWEYIKSKESKVELPEDNVILTIKIDSNSEPYIDINYIDEDGNEAGLSKNLDNIGDSCAESYSDALDVAKDDKIISLVYDTYECELNLIRYRNGNYLGNKIFDDYEETPIFVGYIVRGINLTFEDKIKKLYELMKPTMKNSYDSGYSYNFIFKVNDEILHNIYITKDFKSGIIENEEEEIEKLDKYNLAIIDDTYGIDLSKKSIQKVKK